MCFDLRQTYWNKWLQNTICCLVFLTLQANRTMIWVLHCSLRCCKEYTRNSAAQNIQCQFMGSGWKHLDGLLWLSLLPRCALQKKYQSVFSSGFVFVKRLKMITSGDIYSKWHFTLLTERYKRKGGGGKCVFWNMLPLISMGTKFDFLFPLSILTH